MWQQKNLILSHNFQKVLLDAEEVCLSSTFSCYLHQNYQSKLIFIVIGFLLRPKIKKLDFLTLLILSQSKSQVHSTKHYKTKTA